MGGCMGCDGAIRGLHEGGIGGYMGLYGVLWG